MTMSTRDDLPQTLMESGWIELDPVHHIPVVVRRGMTVLTNEGCTAGHVAAVVMDSCSGKVTHLVLGRLIQTLEYRLASIDLIEAVDKEEILLRIFHPVEESLPIWHGA